MDKEARFNTAMKGIQNWLKSSPNNPLIQKGITPKRTAVGTSIAGLGTGLTMNALNSKQGPSPHVTDRNASSGGPLSGDGPSLPPGPSLMDKAKQLPGQIGESLGRAGQNISSTVNSAGEQLKETGFRAMDGIRNLSSSIKSQPGKAAIIGGAGLAGTAAIIMAIRKLMGKKEKKAGDDQVLGLLLKIAEERYSRLAISSFLEHASGTADGKQVMALQTMKCAADDGQPLHVIISSAFPYASPVDREKLASSLCESAIKYARVAAKREACKHCGAMHEMGDDGKCNRCSKDGGYDHYELKEANDWRDIWNAASSQLKGVAGATMRTTMPRAWVMGKAVTGGFNQPQQQGSKLSLPKRTGSMAGNAAMLGSLGGSVKPKTPGQKAATPVAIK